ncbi:hypothetical protein BLNAU_12872 [Blattamonas nauphoetae]|uniref:Uncharacterized protein n=1 Tax=Blattamonas nauphoetae TaxID=2049346 RepID=A0ABQ9XL39_9EUKA|nr:hypothetical protein BLNAU_24618 [Blattamonas nauphoetae]KAK2952169.1 hypothetical protein BLNAU_12872 [Blattamonas nauphoetae]
MAQSCSPTISQAGLDIPPEQTIIETHAEDVPFEIVNFDDSDLGHVQPPNDLNTIQQQLQPFQIEFSYVSASNIFSIPPIISLFRLFNPYSSLQDPTSFASSHPPQFPFHVHHHGLHQNNIIPIPLLSSTISLNHRQPRSMVTETSLPQNVLSALSELQDELVVWYAIFTDIKTIHKFILREKSTLTDSYRGIVHFLENAFL